MNQQKTLKAGVIGGNWGRVHMAGLRKAGCTIEALVTHDKQLAMTIATEEQIPHYGDDIAILQQCDLVTIATPTATHLDFLQRLDNKPIICEKPLGLTPENQTGFDLLRDKQIFISYPFLHLETAKTLATAIKKGELGTLTRITLVVGVNLPYPKTPVEWFVEDVVHPFSFLFSLFEGFVFQGVQFGQGNNLTVQFTCQGALFDVLLCDWPKPGLHFDMTLVGSQNAYQLTGGFRPERGWWFNPLLSDDLPITPGEPASNNPWMKANYEVMQQIVSSIGKRQTREGIYQQGLFDLARAQKMEQLFLPLWEAVADMQHSRTPDNTASFRWKLE
jgi:Predicted dehydrogenases and related proteins